MTVSIEDFRDQITQLFGSTVDWNALGECARQLAIVAPRFEAAVASREPERAEEALLEVMVVLVHVGASFAEPKGGGAQA